MVAVDGQTSRFRRVRLRDCSAVTGREDHTLSMLLDTLTHFDECVFGEDFVANRFQPSLDEFSSPMWTCPNGHRAGKPHRVRRVRFRERCSVVSRLAEEWQLEEFLDRRVRAPLLRPKDSGVPRQGLVSEPDLLLLDELPQA